MITRVVDSVGLGGPVDFASLQTDAPAIRALEGVTL